MSRGEARTGTGQPKVNDKEITQALTTHSLWLWTFKIIGLNIKNRSNWRRFSWIRVDPSVVSGIRVFDETVEKIKIKQQETEAETKRRKAMLANFLVKAYPRPKIKRSANWAGILDYSKSKSKKSIKLKSAKLITKSFTGFKSS